jgi:hypothetical protein
MDFAKFYDCMRNHGILEHIDSATLDPKAELWKTQHLLAMAQVAKDRDPGLTIDDALSPRELYRALGTVIDLENSVVLNLSELLLVLESLDPQHLRRPTWLRTRSDLINYRAVLDLALFKAQERFPWRIRAPKTPNAAITVTSRLR